MQVHIVQRGAVKPLIDMLDSSDVQLKEMSAFALGRLAQVIVWSYRGAMIYSKHACIYLLLSVEHAACARVVVV